MEHVVVQLPVLDSLIIVDNSSWRFAAFSSYIVSEKIAVDGGRSRLHYR